MKKAIIILLTFLFIIGGCSTGGEISREDAENTALDDVKEFKPDHSNFEIHSIKREDASYRNSLKTYDSWIVIISSKEPGTKEANPNIFYQINAKDGNIIDKSNFAYGE